MGFKLGSPISKVDQRANELIKRGQLTNLDNHYYYYTFSWGEKNYYCVPFEYGSVVGCYCRT